MKKLFVLLLFLTMSSRAVYAAVPEYTEAFYVNDYARVLSDDTTQHILDMSGSLCEQTGAELVVLTVDFTGGLAVSDYAISVFNGWKLGDPQKNNGVLLLLSIGDDDYYALQGKGLEDKLSAGALDEMLFTCLEPDFAAGNYDAGVRKVYDAILHELEKIYAVSAAGQSAPVQTQAQNANTAGVPAQSANANSWTAQTNNGNGGSGMAGLIFIFIIALIFISAFSGRRGRVYYRPRGWIFMPRIFRGWHGHHHHHGRVMPPPRPPMGGKPGGNLSGRIGGGGVSRGSGAGRPGGSFGGGGFGGGGRSSGGFGGGGRTGGGGMSRGGGAGRR